MDVNENEVNTDDTLQRKLNSFTFPKDEDLPSFDLKVLSQRVQEVVNKLVESEDPIENINIVKAIKKDVIENYPNFNFDVTVNDGIEEELFVVLNIRE